MLHDDTKYEHDLTVKVTDFGNITVDNMAVEFGSKEKVISYALSLLMWWIIRYGTPTKENLRAFEDAVFEKQQTPSK